LSNEQDLEDTGRTQNHPPHPAISLKDITSILEVLVDVGDIPGLDAGSETLKHLKSFMEPVENRSEPECVVSFKVDSTISQSHKIYLFWD
jgi:hypothetical protein